MIVTTKMMRNATLLKPRELTPRPKSVTDRWRRERDRWVTALAPASLFHRLFDHIPGVFFFAKNRDGHIMFASEGLRQRYSMHDEAEILGMTDFDLNPGSMAQAYVDDDGSCWRARPAALSALSSGGTARACLTGFW